MTDASPTTEPDTPAGPKGRTGAAARKRATTTGPSSHRPRRRSRAASQPDDEQPANAAEAPGPVVPPVPVRLEAALAEVPDPEVRRRISIYRPQRFADDAEWALVSDLLRLGIAAAKPPSTDELNKLGWILAVHTRMQLDCGTSRTVTGWYSSDAIEATLTGKPPRDVARRGVSSHASRLRRIRDALVPVEGLAAATYRAYDPHGPYPTDDLARFLDHAGNHPRPEVGDRLATLIWLGVGAGPWDRDLPGLTGDSFTLDEHALVVDFPGDGKQTPPRRVPIHHTAEGFLTNAAAQASGDSLWGNIHRPRGLAAKIVEVADVPDSLPRLTLGRLRATWLALVVGGGAPLTALLPAAGVKGERSFGHMVGQVLPLDDATYARALRCSTGPLPTPGELLLPGEHYPAPQVPLR